MGRLRGCGVDGGCAGGLCAGGLCAGGACASGRGGGGVSEAKDGATAAAAARACGRLSLT
eukprot:30226-Prymnesium_polylepis.1